MNIRPVSGNIARSAKRRRHQRVDDIERQLRINTGEQEGRTGNWSRGGFLADGLDDYRTDDRVEGIMEGPRGERVKFSGKVVRVQDDGMRAVQLVSFDSAALLAMQGAESSHESSQRNPASNASSRTNFSANKGSTGSSPDS